jgi:hypothetical protein
MGNNTSKELDSDTLDMSQSSSMMQRGGNKLEHTIQQLVRKSQENTEKSPHFFTDVDFDSAVAMVGGGVVTDSEMPVRRYHNNPNYKKNRKQQLSSVNEYDINLLEKQFGGDGDDNTSAPVLTDKEKNDQAMEKLKKYKLSERITKTKIAKPEESVYDIEKRIKDGTYVPKSGGSIGKNHLSKNVISSDSETYSQIVRNFKAHQTGGYHPVSIVGKSVLSDKSETNSEIVANFKKQQLNSKNVLNRSLKTTENILTGGKKHVDLAQETSDYGNFSIVESEILSQTSDNVYEKKNKQKLLMKGGSKSIILSATSDSSIDYDVLRKKQSSSMNGGGECACTKSGDVVLPTAKLSEIKSGGGKLFSPKKIDSIVSSSSNNPIDYNILVGGKDSVSDSSSDHPINDEANKSSEMSEPDVSMSESSDSALSESSNSDLSDNSSNSNVSSDGNDTNTSSDPSPSQNQKGGLSSSAGITSASEIVINSKFLYSDNTFYGSENVSDKYNSFSSMIE